MSEENEFEKQPSAQERDPDQKKLEQQLRELGATMTDAFHNGFDGRGQQIGDQVWDVGRTVVRVVDRGINDGVSEFERAFDRVMEARSRRDEAAAARQAAENADPKAGWLKKTREACRKLYYQGLALAILCGILAAGLMVGGFTCLALTELAGINSVAETVLGLTGTLLMVGGGFSIWGAVSGGQWMEDSHWMAQCADVVEALGGENGITLKLLAEGSHRPLKKLRKRLKDWLRKGWMTGWLEPETSTLYLTAEDYRISRVNEAGKNAAHGVAAPQPEPQNGETTHLYLETARGFAAVLERQRQSMADPLAAEELDRMCRTTAAICEWLEAHPESMPQARRFAEYYIPTTLKLLQTYNDVQGQKGENAESIRRDIAGILHTLNQAFDHLYDKLLSDTVLDISGEIAALQGMLASDGLTEGGLK